MYNITKNYTQSSFGYSTTAGYNPEPEPVNYVARTDGISQSWRLSSSIYIPPTVDFRLEFDLSVGEVRSQGVFYNSQTAFSNYVRLFTSDAYAYNVLIGFDSSNGAFFKHSDGFNLFDNKLNRIIIGRVSGVVSAYLNGVKDNTERNNTDSLSFDFTNRYANSYLSGVIANLEIEIDGIVTNKIPLTDKSQGATQIATVGNINATMINYTEDVWEVDDNTS